MPANEYAKAFKLHLGIISLTFNAPTLLCLSDNGGRFSVSLLFTYPSNHDFQQCSAVLDS